MVPRPAVAARRAPRPGRRVARARAPHGHRDPGHGPAPARRRTTRGSRRPRRSSSPSPSSGGRSGGACGSGGRCAAPCRRRRRNDPDLLLAGLGAPYDRLNGRVLDGLALYRARASLGLADAVFAAQGVPAVEPADDWQPAELAYSAIVQRRAGDADDPPPRRRRRRLVLGHGQRTESAPRLAAGGAHELPDPRRLRRRAAPAVVADRGPPPRPGRRRAAPHAAGRADADPRHRVARRRLVHRPLAQPDRHARGRHGHAGRGRDGAHHDEPSRSTDWSLFHVSGRRPGRAADLADRGQPARRARARSTRCCSGSTRTPTCCGRSSSASTASSSSEPDAARSADCRTEAPPGQVVATGTRRYRYLPSTTVPHLWHPYLSSDAGNVRRFVQGRLADLNVRPVAPRPGPTSRLLRDPAAGRRRDPAHQILPERGAPGRTPPRTPLRPRPPDRRPAGAVGAAATQRPRRAAGIQPPLRRARRDHRRRDLSSPNWARSVSGRRLPADSDTIRAQILD